MAQLRKNELAALGLVNREPTHGYRLTQDIQRMGLEHWTTLSRSSIYAALRKLKGQGAVSLTHEREGNAPERTVYHITPKGREVLRELLREALAYVGPEDRYFYLGLAFAEALSHEEITTLLGRRLALLRNGICEERQACEALASSLPERAYFAVMSDAGVRHFEVEIAICTKIIEMLRVDPDAFTHLQGACHETQAPDASFRPVA